MRSWLVAVGLVSGCYHPSPPAGAPCNSRGECPSGLECVDDVCVEPGTAVIDAAIDACPETMCLGNELAACGTRYTCALGCAATGVPHCMQLVPSNGITPSLLVGATAQVVALDLHLDSDTGEIMQGPTLVFRAAGTGVIGGIGFSVVNGMGVFTAERFEISAGTQASDDWDVDGSNTAVLYAATTITVLGVIDAGANDQTGGPGGADGATSGSAGPTCRGKAGAWEMAGYGEGGGGGGGRTVGANGAPSTALTFGAAGPFCAASPTTIPLRGGNGGGAGGVDVVPSPDVVHGGVGGGGGGGLALVAMESITITGSIAVPGGGGRTAAGSDGGGGGGSGGAILVEAPVVTITGDVIANGGGGAGPSVNSGTSGHVLDGSAAGGGDFMGVSGGKGGTGAPPTAGSTFTDGVSARGGGGGGAGGRTEIKSRSRTTTGATLAPGPALTDITAE